MVYTFHMGVCLKLSVLARREFELADSDVEA